MLETKKPNSLRFFILLCVSLLFTLNLLSFSRAQAYSVPPLPGGNLLTNPWFRSFSNPNDSSLDGWTDEAGLDKYWSSSQKESNPTPDIVISGVCGNSNQYCGTAGRLSWRPGQSGGIGVPGVDSYLSQVVPSNPDNRLLKFSTWWVSHTVDPAEVIIYGGNSPNGPWTSLWVPFSIVDTGVSSDQDLWAQTELLEKTLASGYSYYKIRIHAKLTSEVQSGFKIAGIFFTTQLAGGTPDPTSKPTEKPRTTPSPPPVNRRAYIPIVVTRP